MPLTMEAQLCLLEMEDRARSGKKGLINWEAGAQPPLCAGHGPATSCVVGMAQFLPETPTANGMRAATLAAHAGCIVDVMRTRNRHKADNRKRSRGSRALLKQPGAGHCQRTGAEFNAPSHSVNPAYRSLGAFLLTRLTAAGARCRRSSAGCRFPAARHAKRLISHPLVSNLYARRVLRDLTLGGTRQTCRAARRKSGPKSIGGSTPHSLGR